MINDLTMVDEAQLLNAQARLDCGVRELGLSLSPQQIQACLMHVLMLKRWNRTHNLTAVSNLNDMVVLHTLDTLSVLPYLY
ncbi:MAG: class I SAM-dependent methyltransferase, partial [Gammaproteobacteria bacterium]